MHDHQNFTVRGLSELQLQELQAQLAACAEQDIETREIRPEDGSGERHGEPTLIGLAMVVTPIAISAFALWLSKQRKSRTSTFIYERTLPDGTVERLSFDMNDYEEGEATAGAIEGFFNSALKVRT
jgi:hypothetical protein